jgi:hypothetical protein
VLAAVNDVAGQTSERQMQAAENNQQESRRDQQCSENDEQPAYISHLRPVLLGLKKLEIWRKLSLEKRHPIAALQKAFRRFLPFVTS